MTASGVPICCVVIMVCQEVEAKHIMGIQPWAVIEGNLIKNVEANSHGHNKYFLHGPTCFYNGNNIPCYVTCSEHGSIMNEILADIMNHLDSKIQFDRTDAKLFMLLDGHGSRFGLPFLEYINNNQHTWAVCIGVPYGTNLWQVGDSSQQNGAFKIQLKKLKEAIINQKAGLCLP